ncbi:hypothetical protein JQT99_12025 [Sulfitobacter mediterraneus]|uniref:hypothetical protein n=1 Tax=Sulfitobacter mediterraneus TaxID=83219 RepID=UPI000AE83C11|nr:hypothetical protein [Sulfitobacter mediterraneus]MBM1310896.1 hypothetical protein [Sulfitobacter mediterraneus]MBM1398398.1 hypothetical protein [Sulfitobacter mediterraneus]MBM1468346.1 hypothetical protein [Sulfitobacter mediterraneus]MBM1476093.1 hypothetical protein [Sulfitobacter mediterraneus]MBM1507082.1 hypothetical protein [Sulfitobacter mediterraneus]
MKKSGTQLHLARKTSGGSAAQRRWGLAPFAPALAPTAPLQRMRGQATLVFNLTGERA